MLSCVLRYRRNNIFQDRQISTALWVALPGIAGGNPMIAGVMPTSLRSDVGVCSILKCVAHMRSDEEINDTVERRLRGYKALRARLNLPPLTDDEQSGQRMLANENEREAADTRRQEQERQRIM
jgi:hypothetical protein